MINWVWNCENNAFAMSDGSMAVFAVRTNRQKSMILLGYTSSIYRFAQFVR
jgi:hypothetical protein